MTYHFCWTCGWMGGTEYLVSGDGEPYRVELRNSAGDYERSIFNGNEETWQRDVVAAIGLLRRSHRSDLPIPPAVVAAFNAWRANEHANHIAEIKADPRRYGEIPDDDPILAPPVPVRGAHYVPGTGWVIDG